MGPLVRLIRGVAPLAMLWLLAYAAAAQQPASRAALEQRLVRDYQAGLAAWSKGDARGARRSWKAALEAARELGHGQAVAAVATNLGLACDRLGDFREAVACHEQSLAASRALRDRAGEARALNNLGTALTSLEQYARAPHLMREFYRQWIVRGVSRREALRRARLALIDSGRWSEPYHWAAFQLQGGGS